MRLRRRFAVLNSLIAVLVAAAGGAGWWILVRPMPQVSGSLAAPVSRPSTIERDRLGVPLVRAETLEDALFLQGFATAQDRFWQMEAMRRLASGQLAEVVGRAALPSDLDMRRLRLSRIADGQVRSLTPDDFRQLAAYARGVNHYLDTHRDRLPVEFRLLAFQPRPWRIADSVLCGLLMFRDMTTTYDDDLRKAALLAAGDAVKVNLLFPPSLGAGPLAGSNAWVISGRHTASGKPLLANDPHLNFSLPSTWHMVHLRAPGLDVRGVALPGLPGVIIGHNDRIAWGVTNLHADVQDLYAERLDLRTGQYLFDGKAEQARAERETVLVKDAAPVEFTNWVTRHGPLIGQGHTLSLRWTAAEPDAFQFPFLDVNRARDWGGFRRALSRFVGPGQNFVYADTDGNIGYQVTGRLPIRRSYVGDRPADGTGAQEWDGSIPFEQLPSLFNPPSGIIVTANQNPFPPGFPYPVSGSFAAPYRARQIRTLLTARPGWRAEEIVAIQKDVYSPFEHFLARAAVAGCADTAGGFAYRESRSLLSQWDGQMDHSLSAPLIAHYLAEEVRRRVGDLAAPGHGAEFGENASSVAVEQLLRTRPAGWTRNWNSLLCDSLTAAVDRARRQLGDDPRLWSYGAHSRLTIPNRVLSAIQVNKPWLTLGPLTWFDIGPVAMSGSPLTVKQTTDRLGPSMRFVADLADWDRSLQNITIGQSGHPLSGHYRDQWDAYYAGRSLPMPFRHVEAKETLRITPAQP